MTQYTPEERIEGLRESVQRERKLAEAFKAERDRARESLRRARARSQRQRAALKITVEACQANLAYAMRKDEHALVRALEAAQAALKK